MQTTTICKVKATPSIWLVYMHIYIYIYVRIFTCIIKYIFKY